MEREAILSQIRTAQEKGLDSIDITDYSNDTAGDYNYYGSITIDDLVVYDKYGDNISKYELWRLPKAKKVYGLDHIDVNYIGQVMMVKVENYTKFYPLQQVLRQDIYEIDIDCGSVNIPAFVFETIVATKLTLSFAIINESILKAIPCYNVTLSHNEGTVDSYESLRCKIFTLNYKPHDRLVPIMPKEAFDVTLGLYGDEDVEFSDNNAIERLTINFLNNSSCDVHIERLSLLTSYIVTEVNDRIITSVDIDTFRQLREFVYNPENIARSAVGGKYHSLDIVLIEKEGIVYISSIDSDELLKQELVVMETFHCNLLHNEQYLLMPYLKNLTVYKALSPEYIPAELEQYHSIPSAMTEQEVDQEIQLEEYLLTMESIKRMPLTFEPKRKSTLPFDERYDVLYNIRVYQEGYIYSDATRQGKSVLDYYKGREDIARAMEHNETYKLRNRDLL